jgi:hypothetical protein
MDKRAGPTPATATSAAQVAEGNPCGAVEPILLADGHQPALADTGQCVPPSYRGPHVAAIAVFLVRR